MQAIGLGKDCAVATTLIQLGIMRADSVFDNKLTKNLSKLTTLLENQASDLFHPDHLLFRGPYVDPYTGEFWRIWDQKYEMLALHTVPYTVDRADAHAYLLDVERPTIESMFQRIKDCVHPHIIRSNDPDTKLEESVRLYDTIKRLRENRPFHLSIIQDTDFADKRWGIKGFTMYRAIQPNWIESAYVWDTHASWNLAFQSILATFSSARVRLL